MPHGIGDDLLVPGFFELQIKVGEKSVQKIFFTMVGFRIDRDFCSIWYPMADHPDF